LEPINPYILISAIILDLLIGDPRWFPHPVVYVGKLITLLEKALRRLVQNEVLGGTLLLVMTVGVT
jgi:adenosylcobinamide-phosphate synthase